MNKRIFFNIFLLGLAGCSLTSSPALPNESTPKPSALSDLPPTWTPDITPTHRLWPTDTPTVTRTPEPTPFPTDLPSIVLSQLLGKDPPSIKSQLAFASSINNQLDIFLLSDDNLDPEPFIQSPLDDIYPVWSPNGKSLAFLRTDSWANFHWRNPDTDLFLVENLVENNLTPDLNLYISELIWSPNGGYIAFSASEKDPEPLDDASLDIYIANIFTHQAARIIESSGVGCQSLSWSPDSQELISVCRGGMVSGLAIDDRTGSNPWFIEFFAAEKVEWLPSGDTITVYGGGSLVSIQAEYMKQRGALDENGYFDWNDHLESLEFQQKPVRAFGWYTADDNLFLIQSDDLIQVVDLNRHEVVSILGNFIDLEGQFTWGPEGEQIAFSYFDGYDAEIGIINIKTLTFSKLTDNLVDDLMPSWKPLE